MRRLLLPLLAVTVLAAGCSDAGSSGGKPQVAVAAYPFAWLVQQVGGDAVRLVDVAGSGVEPHDVELGPREVARLQSADLVVGLKGFQPALDDAVEDRRKLFDLGPSVQQHAASSDLGDEEGGLDPHVWLDPVRMADAATALGERLERLAPGSRARAATTATALKALDARYRDALAGCERRDLVTSHTAFGYLAERYDLQQVGVSGTSPEAEPSPGRLAEVVRYARDNGVTTVFTSPGESSVAETVAREVGATTATLLTLETRPQGGDYLTGMDADLTALTKGLGCA
ncbi:MAG: putative transporter substrate-binding protein [Frankiales bacterium]|nr:putative transporter substrate-binding protein [Frankiales bacterium]